MKQPLTRAPWCAPSCVLLQAHAGDAGRVAEHLVERRATGAARSCRPRPCPSACRPGSPRRGTCRAGGPGAPCVAMFDRYSASSTAVLPPPTTQTSCAAVEEAVAGGAAADAAAHERLLRRQAEVLGRGAGGDDQRVAGVGAGVALQRERALRQVDRVDVVEHDLGVEALGVLAGSAASGRGPCTPVDVGRPVVDVGGRHQLAALRDAGDQHRLQVGARGIDGGGVAGRAGAEDQDAGVLEVARSWRCGVGSVWQRTSRQV